MSSATRDRKKVPIMARQSKKLSEDSITAVKTILDKQPGRKFYGTREHANALAYLAENCGVGQGLAVEASADGKKPARTVEESNRLARREFARILQEDGWNFASNLAKKLVEEGMLESTDMPNEVEY